MLKQHATFFRRLMIFIDVVLVAGACLLAYKVLAGPDHLSPLKHYASAMAAMVVIWALGLYYAGMYTSFRLKRASGVLFIVYQACYVGFLVFVSLCYLLHINDLSRALIILCFTFSTGIVAIEKLLMLMVLHQFRRNGLNYRNVLIIGSGPRAQVFIKALDENRDLGLNIVGILDQDQAKIGEVIQGHSIIGTLSDLAQVTREKVVDQVFFVVPRSWLDEMEEPLLYLEKLGVRVDFAIDHFNLAFARATQTEFFGIPFLSVETTPDAVFPLAIKRLMDIFLSGLALIVLSPLFAVTALIIKATSPGPVLFVQKRVSLNGRTFDLYKFRTMVVDAEAKLEQLKHLNEMAGPVFKLTNDPRITVPGKILRKLSIDELPQLWNVLTGDMSLVGPRPPLVSEVEKYDDWQRRRLSMRPGITCLWQVGGRNRITDFNEWTRLDLKYIDNWSLWMDIKILFRTVPVVLFGIGAK